MNFLKNLIKHPSLHTLSVFAGGNIIVAVLGGLGGLIQARWIGPEVLGEFAKYGILTTYFNIGLVFVNEGLARQFPYLLGKGDKEASLKVAATAKWWYLFMCWFFTLIFAVLSLWSLISGNYRSLVGWGVQILFVINSIYGFYLNTMYRTSFDFKRLSYNNVTAKVVDSIALVCVYFWGFWGLAIRYVFGSMVGLYLNIHYVPVKVKAVFDTKRLLDLAKISLPLAIPGYIGSSFLTASISFIILSCCGTHGLGIYGLAVSFQVMSLIPTQAIHQMFMTKQAYKYGETDDARACLKTLKVPTLLSVCAATALALTLCLVIGPFVKLLLPKYVEAIPIIRILAVQLPISAAGMPLLVISTALWYKHLFALTLVRFLVPLAAIAIMPKTLNVIVWCIILGTLCHVITGYGILMWWMRKKPVAPAM